MNYQEKCGFQKSERFLEWLHNETNFLALNLPPKSGHMNPMNYVWDHFRRHFDGMSLSKIAMEGEIVNYWHILREDDLATDLYDGMRNIMCEVILREGSLLDVDQ